METIIIEVLPLLIEILKNDIISMTKLSWTCKILFRAIQKYRKIDKLFDCKILAILSPTIFENCRKNKVTFGNRYFF